DPLQAPFAVAVDPRIDLAALAAALAPLPGEHDFTAFASAGGAHRSPVRRIETAEWVEEGSALELRLVGDGFLRGMVRALVGSLLEVGRGRRDPAWFADLLEGRPRGAAGPTA